MISRCKDICQSDLSLSVRLDLLYDLFFHSVDPCHSCWPDFAYLWEEDESICVRCLLSWDEVAESDKQEQCQQRNKDTLSEVTEKALKDSSQDDLTLQFLALKSIQRFDSKEEEEEKKAGRVTEGHWLMKTEEKV